MREALQLTSIVILTLNELEYTRRCVDSIAAHTPEPHELIFVDNGSTDGTVEYLRSIPGATVITNGENRGFGGGCNQGIASAAGTTILLLNNDTVATDGWLAAMLRALEADPRRGVVGPRSNHVADRQRVADVGYDVESLDGLDTWASEFVQTGAGSGFEMTRLIGFCLLLRREVIDRIGGFDVRFGLGNFEDDDICMRAVVAGWSCWVCNDSFVHHFGSRTFAGAQIDHSTTMLENWHRFARKWNLPPDLGTGYDAREMLAATSFDAARDFAPIVSARDDDATVEVEHRVRAVLLAADRLRPHQTGELFEHALRDLDDAATTFVVRVDPLDGTAIPMLEHAVDDLPEGAAPDIAIVERSDANDEAVVRACTHVALHGQAAWALEGIARRVGRPVIDLDSTTVASAAG